MDTGLKQVGGQRLESLGTHNPNLKSSTLIEKVIDIIKTVQPIISIATLPHQGHHQAPGKP
jgi:hypothetical protein